MQFSPRTATSAGAGEPASCREPAPPPWSRSAAPPPTWRELAAVFALLLLLGAVFTWPLARHFGTDVLYTHEAYPGYERVPMAQGDHLHLLYTFWLAGDSIREGRSLLADPYQFRSGGPPGFLFQPSLLPLLTFLLAPLGLVAAFNTLTLLSYPAAGLSAYLLMRLETADRAAALAGALVVALFPYRVTQLAGHANGFLAFLVPLYLYCFERSLREERWLRWSLAAGAAFFFSGAMEFHIVYYLTLLLGVYLPVRFLLPLDDWFERRVPPPGGRDLASPLLAAGGGAGLGIAVHHAAARDFGLHGPAGWVVTALGFALLAWLLWRVLLGLGTILDEPPAAGCARAFALPFAPFALLALAPLGSARQIPHLGRALGAAAVVAAALLALPALRALRSARLRPGSRALFLARLRRYLPNLALVAVTLAFLAVVKKLVFANSVAGGGRGLPEVAAFSPSPLDLLLAVNESSEHLVYLGPVALLLAAVGAVAARRVEDPRRRLLLLFSAAVFLLGTLLAVGPNLEVFPVYHLLYKSVPLFNFPRVTARILVVCVVGLAALVTAGAAALRARGGKRAGAVALLCLPLLAIDYLPRRAPGLTTLPAGHPVYDALARERAPGEVILELPIWPGSSAWSSDYLWYVTRYRHPILNGYSPAAPRDYVDRIFWPLYPLDFGEMRRAQYDLLRELGIRFVVFHEEVYPPKISAYPFALAGENLARSPYLELVAAEPPLLLFRLRPDPPPADPAFAATSPVGSLYEGEDWCLPPCQDAPDPLASAGAVAATAAGSTTLTRPIPDRFYPSGSYRVRARFVADGGRPAPLLTLTVRDAATGQVLGTASGRAAGGAPFFDLSAVVALAAPTRLVAGIDTDGAAPARWDFLDVTFADEPEPRLAFEIEELWHMGRPLADPGASGGRAVQLIPGHHPRDTVFSGPDRVLPAGRWTAELRYRAAPGAAGEDFEVALSGAGQALGSTTLPAAGGSGWQTARLPFALARSAPVRFGVRFTGGRDLVLDRIAIAPAD